MPREMPAEDVQRASMEQDMTFVRLFVESNDRTNPPAHMVVRKDSKVEILAGKALIAWQEGNDVISIGVEDDVWVKVRIDGKATGRLGSKDKKSSIREEKEKST